jgi:hypothetical protein
MTIKQLDKEFTFRTTRLTLLIDIAVAVNADTLHLAACIMKFRVRSNY